MKKILLLATLVLGMVSCMKDQSLDANLAGDGNFVLSVALPNEATRAAGEDSALGAIDNDILDRYDVRYTLEVYDVNDQLAKRDQHTVNSAETSFELRLIPGRHYRFVVWADFVQRNAEGEVTLAHYNVDPLTNVTLKGGHNAHNAMDESRDAYTAVFNTAEEGDKDVFSSASTIKMTLTRPFAKLRVVTNDIDEIYSTLQSATVKYTTPIYNGFNALNAEVTGTTDSNVEKTVYFTDAAYKYDGEPTADGKQTLFADYIFGTEDGTVQFTLDVNDYVEGSGVVTALPQVAFNTAIPVERNHLTTIYGPILTDPNTISVEIKDVFTNGNEWNPEEDDYDIELWDGTTKTEVQPTTNAETGETEYVVSSASELAWLADLVNNPTTRATATELNIVLEANIDLNNNPWTAIGTEENYFTGTFNGKGHSIKNLNIEVAEAKEGKAYIGFFGYAKNAEIKDVTFENVYLNIACLDIDHSQGHIGAVAGSLEGTSTIEDVTVKGDIKVESTVTANGASRVAVVAGGNSYGNVTMKNVHVIANEGSYLKANNNVGALAGQLQGVSKFENCSSNIDVTGTKFFAGGIIGLAAGDQTFTNCHTTGNITITAGREGKAHDHYRVGGIAGGWADGAKNVCTLTNCSYTGELSGTNADGSVVDVFDYAGYVGRGYTLNNCQGSKVVIDGVEYVQAYNTAAEAGIYYVNGELILNNAAALKLVASKVNSGADYFAGKTIVLANDIDLNNEEWTPIGSAAKDHGFMGNFDGRGYAIKNLTIKNITPDSDGYVYGGLFGVTEGVDKNNQNSIKNLTIENVDIDLNGDIVAAAIAYPYYTALENITVKGNISIKGGNYTSGVLAYTRRCVDAKDITIVGNNDSVIEGGVTVGGVISDIQMNGGLTANYSNFKAENLTIKGEKCVGGISGIIGAQNLDGATVKNVTIESDDIRTGMISGSFDGVSVITNAVVENVTGADYYIGCLYEGTVSDRSSVTINGDVYTYNNGWLVNGCQVVANGVILNEAGEYLISNAAGMFWFANEVNVNKNTFNGKTIKLASDIDLKSATWTPVGQTGATTFNGVFDGQDYTISNLNVNSEAQTGAHYSSGLFGWVESHTAGHGHLKNVKINGATINGHHNCGALVGYITQQTALVENCHVTGATVTCTKANNDADGDKAGALIGNATVATPVKDCTATNSTVSAGRDAGQVIGAGKEANVTGCSATNVTVSANGTGTGKNIRNEVIGRLL